MSDQVVLKPLKDVASISIGGTPSRAQPQYWAGQRNAGQPWVAISDLGPRVLTRTRERITELGIRNSNAKLVRKGTVVMSFKLTLGKVGLAGEDLYTNEAIAAVEPLSKELSAEWLYYALPKAVHGAAFETAVKGATLNKAKLQELSVPVPASPEVADRAMKVLTALEDNISAVQATVRKLTGIRHGLLRAELSRLQSAPLVPLRELARVGGGITLGKSYGRAATRAFPYLRVANVQDGYVDLTELKTLDVPPALAREFMLRPGDVLMNEGGDFDKLGRGAVWRGEVASCLHQNHVFRVRCDTARLLPDFLALWTASESGRRYFTSQSKQSTNLASINSSQLNRFPVLLPGTVEQQRVVEAMGSVDSRIQRELSTLSTLEKLRCGLVDDLVCGVRRGC